MDEDRKSVADGAGDSLTDRPPVAADGSDPQQACAPALPPRLRRRLDASAEAWINSTAAGQQPAAIPQCDAVGRRYRARQRSGWYAAAVCLLLAIAGWWPRLEAILHDAPPGVSARAPSSMPTMHTSPKGESNECSSSGENILDER